MIWAMAGLCSHVTDTIYVVFHTQSDWWWWVSAHQFMVFDLNFPSWKNFGNPRGWTQCYRLLYQNQALIYRPMLVVYIFFFKHPFAYKCVAIHLTFSTGSVFTLTKYLVRTVNRTKWRRKCWCGLMRIKTNQFHQTQAVCLNWTGRSQNETKRISFLIVGYYGRSDEWWRWW